MDSAVIAAIRANLYPGAHPAIPDWHTFAWHCTGGRPDTDQPHSSQALAIDVFGTLAGHPARHEILNNLAARLGLPGSSRWKVHLEWSSASNPLQEINHLTQVDALAESADALVLFECKFNEKDGGACSQTLPRPDGGNAGKKQCSGNYTVQTNPITGRTSRCALSAKGIRYWKVIPKLFQYNAEAEYSPCPFAGPSFQWMRNIAGAHAEGELLGKRAAFCLVYADAPGLGVSEMLRSATWQEFLAQLRPDCLPVQTISYQDLLQLAQEVDPAGGWEQLAHWVNEKIHKVPVRKPRRRKKSPTG